MCAAVLCFILFVAALGGALRPYKGTRHLEVATVTTSVCISAHCLATMPGGISAAVFQLRARCGTPL